MIIYQAHSYYAAGDENMKKNKKTHSGSKVRAAALLFILIAGLLVAVPSAHANYFQDFYNGVEKFSDLPGQVNQLNESYQETLDELDRTKQNAKAFEEQNAQLMEQNRQLAETVSQLKQINEQKEAKAKKLKVTLITVILLVAGYFVGIRLLRLLMRRSNR